MEGFEALNVCNWPEHSTLTAMLAHQLKWNSVSFNFSNAVVYVMFEALGVLWIWVNVTDSKLCQRESFNVNVFTPKPEVS